MAIAHFSIAVDRRFKKQEDQDTADFFNCTAFGKTGEFVGKYFHKGSRILVSGRLQNDNYTNKNGEKVYAVQIIAEEVEFGDSKNSSSSDSAPAAQTDPAAPELDSIPDAITEELPFN